MNYNKKGLQEYVRSKSFGRLSFVLLLFWKVDVLCGLLRRERFLYDSKHHHFANLITSFTQTNTEVIHAESALVWKKFDQQNDVLDTLNFEYP